MGELTLNRAHDGRIVEVKFGDRVTVRLPETPATGFRWALDEAGSNVLQLETERNELASGTGVGGGGHRVFVFRSSKAGDAELRLKLWRDWEGPASVTDRFHVTVRVRN